MSLTIKVGDVIHPLNKNKTILENLELQNIPSEFQCREGYCGSCRVVKISGDVKYDIEPIAWLRENEILTCCCKPTSDIQISYG